MAGLIEKDIRLLFQKKMTVMFVFVLLFVFIQSGTFVLGFTMFLGIILATSTISYDEFDNGYPFLMTLPITRKIYVREKYILCLATIVCSCAAALCLCVVSSLVKGEDVILLDMFITVAVLLTTIALIADFMIPVQLKFGAEKSKIALVLFSGITSVIVYAVVKIAVKVGVDINAVVETIDNIPNGVIAAVIIAAILIVTAVSYLISCCIMNKKEL